MLLNFDACLTLKDINKDLCVIPLPILYLKNSETTSDKPTLFSIFTTKCVKMPLYTTLNLCKIKHV